jgi:hypothetical protein
MPAHVMVRDLVVVPSGDMVTALVVVTSSEIMPALVMVPSGGIVSALVVVTSSEVMPALVMVPNGVTVPGPMTPHHAMMTDPVRAMGDRTVANTQTVLPRVGCAVVTNARRRTEVGKRRRRWWNIGRRWRPLFGR